MVLNLLALAVALVLLYAFVYHRHPVRATLSFEGVVRSQQLPHAIKKRLAKFARENVEPGSTVHLQGKIEPNGRIRWVFDKKFDRDLAQRLRNFMVSEVYL